MKISALQLESRFSLPPNSLGYCGRDTAAAKFKECIIDGKCDGVGEEVTKFIVLHPYLKLLAEISNQPMLSYPVIESYWLGNDLLKNAKAEHYELLMKNFLKQGVPDFFVEELRQKQPKKFIPNHLFQVLHVGVGRASGAVPFNLKSINNCMIRWGKVVSCHSRAKSKYATIKLYSLKNNQNNETMKQFSNYELTTIKESIPFNPELVPGLKIDDIVAVHWNMVIKILTKDEENKIEYWTQETIGNLG